MAYKVIILYRLYMPSYFLGTFTEYPNLEWLFIDSHVSSYNTALFLFLFLGFFYKFCLIIELFESFFQFFNSRFISIIGNRSRLFF